MLGGTIAPSAAVQPRWFASGTPNTWDKAQFETWIGARGLTNLGEISPQGSRAWFFKGQASTQIGSIQQTFTFSSGISISLARSSSKTEKPKLKPAFSWGARLVKPDKVDSPLKPDKVDSAMDVDESQSADAADSAAKRPNADSSDLAEPAA